MADYDARDADTRYNPRAIEERWLKAWQDKKAFATPDKGEPFYILEMFPYPSGALHMGHVRNYTIGDVFARFHRMQGRRVLHPMGWDALGLPAENQAIKERVAPQIRTPKNIEEMKAQMERLGLAYDWSREIGTYEPEYYHWNQWFFIKFFEKNLVYRRQSTVNWCPGCNTVLANEQVRDDGECWRGHPGVTTRSIPEWAFKITHYAEQLLQDLDQLKAWPSRIVTQQRNWIGKSVGARVRFPVHGHDASIEIFTTRVDTIYGCTYVVLAPEHPLALEITTPEQRGSVDAFIEAQRKIDKLERTAEGAPKEGVLTGATATHPYTGRRIPIWLANFVVADYGTGAVMSVPAHDQRDFEFAEKYQLPIEPVIWPEGGQLDSPLGAAFTLDGVVRNSGPFDGLTSADARPRMADHAAQMGFGERAVTWHLRDWGFSRQRYWGTPIPIVYCDACGVVPLSESDLPVILPDFDAVNLTGEGGAPLAKLPSFFEAKCPRCGGPGRRETETMDTFVDSAWYFARFLSPRYAEGPFEPEEAKTWLPIDVYVGGPEHAVMHLLYFRFWTKAMRDLGLLEIDEPATRLITQGMVNAEAVRCPTHGYIPAADIKQKDATERVCSTCGKALTVAVEKMSKSKYNGVDPMELIDQYGADTARLYTLFAAPPEKDLEWNPDGVEGISRFMGRVFRVMQAQRKRAGSVSPTSTMAGLSGSNAEVRRAVHRTLAKVTEEVGARNHFNTAIAAMMELVNTFHDHKLHLEGDIEPGVVNESMRTLGCMLAPLAPFLAEEIWSAFGGDGLVLHARWPSPDPEAIRLQSVTVAVQVNGKVRAQVELPVEAGQADAIAAAKAEVNVKKWLEGKTIRKEIFVPRRLINFVVS